MILWSNILIPVTSMLITVFATLYTVSGRIKNENKEKHKPYLILEKIDNLKEIDKYKYYLTILGKGKSNDKDENNLAISLIISNIGYGVASNIKFYDLLRGTQLQGNQKETKNQNQKLFTTLDIANNNEKQIQAQVISKIVKEENIEEIDHSRILCVYQDLNGNVYDFIISINVKTNNTYDFFAYQRTSHSYEKWINQNRKEYKIIMKQYKK